MDAQIAWEEYRQDVGRFIASRLNDKTIVEDVLHDVYLKAQAKFDQLQDPKRYKNWVLKIAQNTVTDYYRGQLEARSLENEASIPDDVAPFNAWGESLCVCHPIYRGSCPKKDTAKRCCCRRCKATTIKEVSRRMGLSLSATKSRIARGKKMLKEKFDTCEIFNFGATPRYYRKVIHSARSRAGVTTECAGESDNGFGQST